MRDTRSPHPPASASESVPEESLSVGEIGVAATRLLPDAFPAVAPLDNVGIARSLVRLEQRSFDAPSPRRAPRGCPLRQCWDPTCRATPVTVLPTLSKTAPRTGARGRHPAEGETRHARTRRCRQSAIRIDCLTPDAVSAPRSAAERARGIPSHSAAGAPRLCSAIREANCYRLSASASSASLPGYAATASSSTRMARVRVTASYMKATRTSSSPRPSVA